MSEIMNISTKSSTSSDVRKDKKRLQKQNYQILDYKLLKIYKSDWFNFHQSQYYRKCAVVAATKMKIFTIYGTDGGIIRELLLKRGWVEKFAPKYLRHLQLRTVDSLLENVEPNNDYERTIISKMTDKYYANFLWNSPKSCRYKCLTGLPYTNRIIRERNLDFTNLDGLHRCIAKIQKYKIIGHEYVQTPRIHNLILKEDFIEYSKSYRITYCLSLLLYINKQVDTSEIFHEFGAIPLSVIRFAIELIRAKMTYAVSSELSTITDFLCSQEFGDNEWNIFLQNVNNLINGRAKIKLTNKTESKQYLLECEETIAQASKHWPLLPWIGCNNLWIIKPYGCANGNGVAIKQDHNEIISYIKKRPDKRYILQKYIERPYLVHNTKFDIHQYIMLTVTETTFSIWMHRDCYIKFSEFEYNLDNLSKTIHIPNNISNKSCTNFKKCKRNDNIPSHNIWSQEQLRTYLNENQNEDIYIQIYENMKKIIISIILASLDKNRFIPKTFELFRCDFILTQNYLPVLIEINSTPDLSPTTIITENLFRQIFEDIIKVVIDLPKNRRSSTGHFDLIYEYESN